MESSSDCFKATENQYFPKLQEKETEPITNPSLVYKAQLWERIPSLDSTLHQTYPMWL